VFVVFFVLIVLKPYELPPALQSLASGQATDSAGTPYETVFPSQIDK